MCIRDRCKAIKVLPYFCVVHKQDWFIKEKYKPELQKDDMLSLIHIFLHDLVVVRAYCAELRMKIR